MILPIVIFPVLIVPLVLMSEALLVALSLKAVFPVVEFIHLGGLLNPSLLLLELVDLK